MGLIQAAKVIWPTMSKDAGLPIQTDPVDSVKLQCVTKTPGGVINAPGEMTPSTPTPNRSWAVVPEPSLKL